MSSNTPNQPGEGSEFGNVPPQESHTGGADPLANNPYSAQYRQGPAPDLDAGAPMLRSNDMQRMNRRALVFLAAIVALLAVLGIWLFKSATSHAPDKAKTESIEIPEAPRAPPPLPAVARQTQQPPIPLVTPPPPLPNSAKMQPKPTAARGPTLLDRRIEASANAGDQNAQAPAAPAASGQAGAGGADEFNALKQDAQTSAEPLVSPDTLLVRGTFIRCVLQTRIITDLPGYSSCIVTEPVYSFNGRRLLLPKGSKVLGKYQGEPTGDRIAVIWDRIVTPNGIDVNMKGPGVDDLGGSGLPGYVDSHWPSRIGSALLISMLSDAFSYEAAEHGPKTASITTGVAVETPFQSNTAQTLQQIAGQAVRKAASRPVTITINQGTIIDVYVAKDVDFSGVVARF